MVHLSLLFVFHMSQALRTQTRARNAVNFLNGCLESKHPRIMGQTPAEVGNSPQGDQSVCVDSHVPFEALP